MESMKVITRNNLSTLDSISAWCILVFWTLCVLGLVKFDIKLHGTCIQNLNQEVSPDMPESHPLLSKTAKKKAYVYLYMNQLSEMTGFWSKSRFEHLCVIAALVNTVYVMSVMTVAGALRNAYS